MSYVHTAIDSLNEAFEGNTKANVGLVLPTGGGKMMVIANMLESDRFRACMDIVDRPVRALVISPNSIMADQVRHSFSDADYLGSPKIMVVARSAYANDIYVHLDVYKPDIIVIEECACSVYPMFPGLLFGVQNDHPTISMMLAPSDADHLPYDIDVTVNPLNLQYNGTPPFRLPVRAVDIQP